MTVRDLASEVKRSTQVPDEQAARVVSVDFRTEVRPDRARALAQLLFGEHPEDQDELPPVA